MGRSLLDLGERGAIGEIRKIYGYGWPEDDSFYFKTGGGYTLLTTDMIKGATHVPTGASSESVGYFAAAINLSDIAAMGGVPKYFMSAIAMPKDSDVAELKGIERGIAKCLKKYSTRMAGGDLKEGELTIAGFAVGEVESRRIIRRKGVRVGDVLCVTGKLGKNAAAFRMYAENPSGKMADMVLEVEPRIPEGRVLGANGVVAGMDLSDGVYSAISQLGRINKIGFEIDAETIPVHPLVDDVVKKLGADRNDLALNFGGEYELLFTVSKNGYDRVRKAMMRRGFAITAIGSAIRGASRLIKDGKGLPIIKTGYEHFRVVK